MRCEPHPISGAVYEELGQGLVRVADKAKGKAGIFKWDGTWIEGDLTHADLHYLRFIGGPTLPPAKDVFWSFMPVTEEVSVAAAGPQPSDDHQGHAEQRVKIIAPYAGDPGKQTDEGVRSSSYIPMEFFLESDRRKELIPEVYRKSSPLPGGPKRVHVARFHDKAYYDLEVEKLWKKVWQMACREDDIPDVGDYLLYKVANLEYIIVRSSEHEFKAHVNACLHRGRKLCERNGKQATEFRCPYHGWSWKVDGTLKGIACEWDFPGVHDEVSQLPHAQVATWGGFIFINPDPEAISLEKYMGQEMIEHYAKIKVENRYKHVHVGKVIKANWKLVQEAFLESYHSLATHPQLLLEGGTWRICALMYLATGAALAMWVFQPPARNAE